MKHLCFSVAILFCSLYMSCAFLASEVPFRKTKTQLSDATKINLYRMLVCFSVISFCDKKELYLTGNGKIFKFDSVLSKHNDLCLFMINMISLSENTLIP